MDPEGQVATEEGQEAPESFTKEDVDRIAEERVRAATSTAHKQLDLTKKELDAIRAERDDFENKISTLSTQVETFKKAGSFDDAEAFAQWQAEQRAHIEQGQRELGRRAMEVTRAELAAQYGVPKDVLSTARSEAEMYRRVLDFTHENPSPQATSEPEPPPPPQPKPNVGGTGNPAPRSDLRGAAKIGEGLRQRPDFEAIFNSYPG